MKRTHAFLILFFTLSLLLFPQVALAADNDSAAGTRDVVIDANLKTQSEVQYFGQTGCPDVLPEFESYDYWTTITLTSEEDSSVSFQQRIVWGSDATSQQIVFPDVPYGRYSFSFKHESNDPNGIYKDAFGFEYAGNNNWYRNAWVQSNNRLDVTAEGLQLVDNSWGRSDIVQKLTCNFLYTFKGRFLTITKNVSVFPGSDMPTGEQTFKFTITLDGEIPGLWTPDVLTRWKYAYLTDYEETASITIDFDQYSSPEEIEPASVTVRVPAGQVIAGISGGNTAGAGQAQVESGEAATEDFFLYGDPRMPAWAQFDWVIDEVEAPKGWNDCLPEGGDTLTMNALPVIQGMLLASTGTGNPSESDDLVPAEPNEHAIDMDTDGNWVEGPTWPEVYAWEYDISLRNVYSANVVLPECSREIYDSAPTTAVSFEKAFVSAEGCELPEEACTFTFELDGYRNRLESDTSLVDTFVHLTQAVEYQPGDTSATVTFEDVPAGRYTLVEVDVPEGWTSDLDESEGILVYVAEDGTVTFEEPGTPIDELGDGATEFTVTNTSSYVPSEEPVTPDTPGASEEPDASDSSAPVSKSEVMPATGDPVHSFALMMLVLGGAALAALVLASTRARIKS